MANTTSNANTISSTVVLTDKGVSDPCVSDTVLAELIERLQGTVEFANPANAIVSVSPPTDLTKIWFEQNSTGVVTNIKYYNSLTGQWEDVVSTSPENSQECLAIEDNAIERDADECLKVSLELFLKNSTASDNLIDLDSEGALYLKESVLKDVAATLDDQNPCNVLQKNATTSALSVNKGAGFLQDVGVAGSVVQGHVISENSPTASPQTLDLTTVPNINWDADCPPTHALVMGVVVIGVGTGFSSGSWAAPAVAVAAGVDNTRVALAIDADSQEGSTIAQMIVRLDPVNPETFTYHVNEQTSVNWTNTKNHVALYLQGLLWNS